MFEFKAKTGAKMTTKKNKTQEKIKKNKSKFSF